MYVTVEAGKKDSITILNRTWKNNSQLELGNPVPEFKIRLLDTFQNICEWKKEDVSSLSIEAKLIDTNEDVFAGICNGYMCFVTVKKSLKQS